MECEHKLHDFFQKKTANLWKSSNWKYIFFFLQIQILVMGELIEQAHTCIDATSHYTNREAQTKQQRGEVDVAEWVEWWQLGQHQHDNPENPNERVQWSCAIWIINAVNQLQKKHKTAMQCKPHCCILCLKLTTMWWSRWV